MANFKNILIFRKSEKTAMSQLGFRAFKLFGSLEEVKGTGLVQLKSINSAYIVTFSSTCKLDFSGILKGSDCEQYLAKENLSDICFISFDTEKKLVSTYSLLPSTDEENCFTAHPSGKLSTVALKCINKHLDLGESLQTYASSLVADEQIDFSMDVHKIGDRLLIKNSNIKDQASLVSLVCNYFLEGEE